MLPVVLPVSKRPPQRSKLLHVLHCQASLETMRKRRKRKLVLTLRGIVLRRLRVEAIKKDQDQQRSKGKIYLHLCLLLTALPFLIPVHPFLLRLVLFLSALLPLHSVNHVLVRRLNLAPLHRISSGLEKRVVLHPMQLAKDRVLLRKRQTRFANIQRIWTRLQFPAVPPIMTARRRTARRPSELLTKGAEEEKVIPKGKNIQWIKSI